MTDDMHDEERPMDALDRLIATTAREYNAPPATVPRDAMWAAIVAARIPAAPDAAPAVVRPIESAPSVRTARRTPARAWWGLAAAAVIFLATGVGIGRWWGRSSEPAAVPGRAIASIAAADPAAVSPDTTSSPVTLGPADAERVTDVGVTVPATAGVARSGRSTTRSGARIDGAPSTDAYDVTLVNHFAQAEALLVSYRADTLDAALDARLARWARPLLGDTRLLLDSPAAADPRRRRLLEDLELVLAQVARLAPPARDTAADSGTAGRTERRLIDGAMRRAQLLPRLRTVVDI